MTTVVYVSYTGALEPLGQSQVIAYLRGLTRRGVRFVLVTFEKPTDLARPLAREQRERELQAAGIAWQPLLYRSGLAGKLRNLAAGSYAAWRAARRENAVLFHARSHMAAAMAALARLLHGGRLVFDLRGEIADEYADIGHWTRGGWRYRATRALERRLVERADGLVVLSERLAARVGRRRRPPAVVIPCCVDREVFRPDGPVAADGLPEGRPLLVYAGSVGTWYLLPEMLALARLAARECGAHFLLLSRADPAAIADAAAGAGLDPAHVTCRAADYADVPRYLRRATAGVAFIRPVPSKTGSSPTKIAEYLACGVPVIANAGVGDLEDFVEAEGVGVLVRDFGQEELARAARFVAESVHDRAALRRRCLEVAARRFDLIEVGVARYGRLYEELGAR